MGQGGMSPFRKHHIASQKSIKGNETFPKFQNLGFCCLLKMRREIKSINYSYFLTYKNLIKNIRSEDNLKLKIFLKKFNLV